MVSNNPLNKKEVKIYRYQGVEWAGLLAADIFQRYTGLNVFFPNQLVASGSDSYSYWLNNFPAAYLEEMYFSPNWHRPSDTLGNCNIPYLADITKGALAVIMEQQFLPSPVGIYAKSSRENIRLGWKPTKNTNVSGYNLYRSDTTGSGFVKINSTAIADSSYYDSSIIPGKLYYYHLTVLNDSAQESMPSSEVSGARFNFTDSLLVLAALKGNVFTPDSVLAFYTGILDSIPFRWFDFSQTHQPGLNTISHYQSILFLINDFSVDPPDQNLLQVLRIFFDNGGNMLFSGFQPTGYFDNTTGYPRKLSPESFSRTYFKADSVNFKFNSIMNRANAAFPGYDTLYTDTHKTLDPSFPGEIFNIEVFAPASSAHVIYRFNSQYPPSTSQGKMQNKPVGLEYMGSDFRTVLLSFPLYYMDTLDAKKLINYILKYKFSHPTGLPEPGIQPSENALRIYPNPFTSQTMIAFHLDNKSDVLLNIYDMLGTLVSKVFVQSAEAGDHVIPFNARFLLPGVYMSVLHTGKSVTSAKMIVVR